MLTEKEMKKRLQKAKGFVRSSLAKILRIRSVPQLIFIFDNSFKYGEQIDDLLKKVTEGENSNGREFETTNS